MFTEALGRILLLSCVLHTFPDSGGKEGHGLLLQFLLGFFGARVICHSHVRPTLALSTRIHSSVKSRCNNLQPSPQRINNASLHKLIYYSGKEIVLYQFSHQDLRGLANTQLPMVPISVQKKYIAYSQELRRKVLYIQFTLFPESPLLKLE